MSLRTRADVRMSLNRKWEDRQQSGLSLCTGTGWRRSGRCGWGPAPGRWGGSPSGSRGTARTQGRFLFRVGQCLDIWHFSWHTHTHTHFYVYLRQGSFMVTEQMGIVQLPAMADWARYLGLREPGWWWWGCRGVGGGGRHWGWGNMMGQSRSSPGELLVSRWSDSSNVSMLEDEEKLLDISWFWSSGEQNDSSSISS